MSDTNFGKMNIKIVITHSNVALYQISVNLENFRFCDQICPKNMNEKKIEKIYIKLKIKIQQCTPVPNLSQFRELQFFA